MYPYEYKDSFKRFSEDKLPDKSRFYSSLKDEWVNERDCPYAIYISNIKMNAMNDYQDLYLEVNVLLFSWCFWRDMLRISWIRSLSLF